MVGAAAPQVATGAAAALYVPRRRVLGAVAAGAERARGGIGG